MKKAIKKKEPVAVADYSRLLGGVSELLEAARLSEMPRSLREFSIPQTASAESLTGENRAMLSFKSGKVSRSKSAEFRPALTPKELCLIAQGCERSELPWGTGQSTCVSQRGSIIGVSRMTQPFQGKAAVRSSSQGSPRARATLGYETQLLRSKDPRSTPNLDFLKVAIEQTLSAKSDAARIRQTPSGKSDVPSIRSTPSSISETPSRIFRTLSARAGIKPSAPAKDRKRK